MDELGTIFEQDDTPKPSSKDVFIQSTPSATFFVSQYKGFGMDDITISAKVCLLHLMTCCTVFFREGLEDCTIYI